jgi:hypothetical protein
VATDATFHFVDSYPSPLANTYSYPHIGTYVYPYPLSNPNSYHFSYAYTNVYRNRN